MKTFLEKTNSKGDVIVLTSLEGMNNWYSIYLNGVLKEQFGAGNKKEAIKEFYKFLVV